MFTLGLLIGFPLGIVLAYLVNVSLLKTLVSPAVIGLIGLLGGIIHSEYKEKQLKESFKDAWDELETLRAKLDKETQEIKKDSHENSGL